MELPIPAALPPLKPTFLIGTGYCREAGEEHDTFESWADCSAAYACVAECQESAACVAVAWAATPQTPHDGCKDAGKPRCATRDDGRGEALRQAAAEASQRAGQLASEAKSRAVRGRQERANLL
ncbi:hypothetical protein EMIHUDRAFT_230756 [Emiliania huxleyi CCMP1516]|uniref:Apple domain-containing protein n=2 Tax=Emiliania huxleyi TaxID=2903 RepID=A0A0D3K9Z7_EMIH1|nr:hypothetical protein EMIHUDRAFT_230756 [Emiliania huxleyi CCMP1516]EOD32582.1 hypothetical protein EMIHUDRAFT_230756 [Emiliania huxleyi CCMP1516]|eukprot:XP_005785011.1 hypothetical protein EMIHUDRAFT_230756 [Emiliania huxleyi CCMP1516]